MKTDTYTRVFEVADSLLAEGVRPTQQNVRQRLGKGSTSTIHKALGEWWQTVGLRLQQGRSYPDLPDTLADAMINWWHTAVDQSRRESEGQRDQAARQTKLLHQAHAEQLEQLRAQQSESLDRLSAQMAQSQQLQQQLHEQRSDQLDLEQRVLSAESSATELVRENRVQVGIVRRLEEECEALRQQLSSGQQHKLQQENTNLRALVAELDSKYNQLSLKMTSNS